MAFPLIPLLTTALSLGSAAKKKREATLAEKAAEEKLNSTPKYKPNQSILSYYDSALRKFNTAATDTAQYKSDKQNIRQGTTQALSSLNKLRSGDVANIIQGQNNALLKAAVNAENRKVQEFGVLGQAAQMKAGQDAKAFQQNELYPFEAKYNLMTMKAAGLRAGQRQETQNAYQNAAAAASILAGEDSDENQEKKFGNRYGRFGDNGYNWAQANGMNFRQFKSNANKVGRSLKNFGY